MESEGDLLSAIQAPYEESILEEDVFLIRPDVNHLSELSTVFFGWRRHAERIVFGPSSFESRRPQVHVVINVLLALTTHPVRLKISLVARNRVSVASGTLTKLEFSGRLESTVFAD